MNEKLSKRFCQSSAEIESPGISWAWWVYFVQIPLVFWYVKGWIPIHPIVVMLPLVGILNFNVEKRDSNGLGLHCRYPGRSLLVAVVFAGLSFIGWWVASRLEGIKIEFPIGPGMMAGTLIQSFLVSISIIAIWEEIVNRGYLQTRFQARWGFWGVILTSLLFASMHIPSTLIEHDNDLSWVAFRFAQTSLIGFALGYVFWRSGSVITTIAVHGLNNFLVTGVLPLFSSITSQQLSFSQAPLHLLWLVGQVGLTVLFCEVFFKDKGNPPT